MRSRKVHGVIIASVISVISIWAASGFTREPPPPTPPPPGMQVGTEDVTLAADAPQWKLLRLGPAQPATTHFSDAVPARVKIDETRAAKVGSPLAGRVTQVFVELGQPVKAGDALFTVASPDIAGLRAEREKASVDLDLAKAQFERVKAMVLAHALPAKDELEANQQFRSAQVAVHLAQAKIGSLKVSSRADNEFTVVSPEAGIIVEKNVLPSQQVQSDPGLVNVADVSSVWVVADLFEADAIGIEPGTAVQVTSPSIPDFKVEAKVEMVSAVVDPSRHTVPVRVRLDNPKHLLKPNVFAQMRFSVKPPEDATEIDATALVSDGAKQYVYVQSDRGRFVRREVIAGSVREGRVPITRGLKAGEVVVEEGAILLDNQIALSH
jgi:RND family efflux transporter MFP subunit